jgi:hypothetical protein
MYVFEEHCGHWPKLLWNPFCDKILDAKPTNFLTNIMYTVKRRYLQLLRFLALLLLAVI